MSRILYIDACAGAAGDMLAGALLDLGWPLAELEALPAKLGLDGVTVKKEAVTHQGIKSWHIAVDEGGDHSGRHSTRPDHEQHRPHRNLSQVLKRIFRLEPHSAKIAALIFERLASAEASAHGMALEEVHFHEVGTADSIIDVAAFASGLAWLGVERVVASPLPLGRGFVDCAHGRIPLPGPAVLTLLEGVPVTSWPEDVETVTPTGAACITTVAQSYGGLPAMKILKAGVGGGDRESGHAPNILRLILGEESREAHWDRVVELVCHLDDQSPEDLPIVIQRLLEAGALDAAAAPLVMKKGRPGLMLVAVAPPELADDLAGLVLEQTTTLGVRMAEMKRRILERRIITVESPWGPVRIKRAGVGKVYRYHPEADDVARICRETGLPPHEVRMRLVALAK